MSGRTTAKRYYYEVYSLGHSLNKQIWILISNIWIWISLIVLECYRSDVTERVEVCIAKMQTNLNQLIKHWLDLKFTRNSFWKKITKPSCQLTIVYSWWRKGFLQESIKWLIFYKLIVRWLQNSKFPLNWSFMLNLYPTIWKNLHQSWFSFYFFT